jgi:Domain of unknown function (DUF1911)/Domain of unknown function (DUF1910)
MKITMKRDLLKDQDYLDSRIEKLESLLAGNKKTLEEGKVSTEQLIDYQSHVASRMLQLAILTYSSGKSVDEMLPLIAESLPLIYTSWEYKGEEPLPDYFHDDYSTILWIGSILVCLEPSGESLEKVRQIWSQANRKDWLLDFIFSNGKVRDGGETQLLLEKPYFYLKEVARSQKPEPLLKRYLENEWYKGHKDCYWYENHRGRHETYFGYWSFESAAIVKILGIDDSSFRDNQYYPKDMLG